MDDQQHAMGVNTRASILSGQHGSSGATSSILAPVGFSAGWSDNEPSVPQAVFGNSAAQPLSTPAAGANEDQPVDLWRMRQSAVDQRHIASSDITAMIVKWDEAIRNQEVSAVFAEFGSLTGTSELYTVVEWLKEQNETLAKKNQKSRSIFTAMFLTWRVAALRQQRLIEQQMELSIELSMVTLQRMEASRSDEQVPQMHAEVEALRSIPLPRFVMREPDDGAAEIICESL